MNASICAVSFYRAEHLELSPNSFEPPIPIMPFDIVADDFTFL